MFAPSVTYLREIRNRNVQDVDLDLWINAKFKYADGKGLCNFLFVGNNNVCPICHPLRDINSRNVHDFDPDL